LSGEGPDPSPLWDCDDCVDSAPRGGYAGDGGEGGRDDDGGGSCTVVCDPEIDGDAKARRSLFVLLWKENDDGSGEDDNNNAVKAIATIDVAVIFENNTWNLTYH
jgi:hypothetical protein